MKLSLKVGYACRVLAQLALTHGQQKLPSIGELAKAEEISPNYLGQILTELRGSGLITSRRGAQGGYALAKPPREITLYDIVHAVERELLDPHLPQQGMSGKRVAEVWKEVAATLREKAKEYTLEDLTPRTDEKMYYI